MMKTYKEIIECDATAPLDTIGMGNPEAPTDSEVGSGDTFDVSQKKKRKKFKSLKEGIFNTKEVDGQIKELADWQWFINLFREVINSHSYKAKSKMRAETIAEFERRNIKLLKANEADKIVKSGGVVFSPGYVANSMRVIKKNGSKYAVLKLMRLGVDEKGTEWIYSYKESAGPDTIKGFDEDTFYEIPAVIFDCIYDLDKNERNSLKKTLLKEGIFDTDEIDADLKLNSITYKFDELIPYLSSWDYIPQSVIDDVIQGIKDYAENDQDKTSIMKRLRSKDQVVLMYHEKNGKNEPWIEIRRFVKNPRPYMVKISKTYNDKWGHSSVVSTNHYSMIPREVGKNIAFIDTKFWDDCNFPR